MKIDRVAFWDGYRAAFGHVERQERVRALEELLGFIERDQRWKDVQQLACFLSQIKHEVADTWAPIAEYGHGAGKPYGAPLQIGPASWKSYYGRGFVQLTWAYNYGTFTRLLGLDLIGHPELALVPRHAYEIAALGMHDGLFTGVALSHYIHGEQADYVNARRIINGIDKANLIAGYAVQFEGVLRTAASLVP